MKKGERITSEDQVRVGEKILRFESDDWHEEVEVIQINPPKVKRDKYSEWYVVFEPNQEIKYYKAINQLEGVEDL